MPSDIDRVFERIAELISQNPDAIAFAGGVSDDWVDKAEKALSLKFPPSFVTYLRKFGGGMIGGEQVNGILGIDFEEACGPDIVYNTTVERREFGIPEAFVCLVSNEGDEMFYLDTSTVTDANENPVVRVLIEQVATPQQYAQNFAEFLLKRIEFYLAASA